MAFINERIPEDFKNTFDFSIFSGPFSYWKPKDIELYKWTVDRERDAFLLHLASGGRGLPEEPTHSWFVLYSKGDLLYFDSEVQRKKDEHGWLMTWTNPNIRIQNGKEGRSTELIALLYEALAAMGWLWDSTRVYAVKVGDVQIAAVTGAQK